MRKACKLVFILAESTFLQHSDITNGLFEDNEAHVGNRCLYMNNFIGRCVDVMFTQTVFVRE